VCSSDLLLSEDVAAITQERDRRWERIRKSWL
jgi:hypothetical protein